MNVTTAQLKAWLLDTLERNRPNRYTAGELQRTANAAGIDVGRGAVNRRLQEMVADGEIVLERAPVERNGHTVPNAAHYRATYTEGEQPEGS